MVTMIGKRYAFRKNIMWWLSTSCQACAPCSMCTSFSADHTNSAREELWGLLTDEETRTENISLLISRLVIKHSLETFMEPFFIDFELAFKKKIFKWNSKVNSVALWVCLCSRTWSLPAPDYLKSIYGKRKQISSRGTQCKMKPFH